MNELDLIKLNIFEAYDNGEITYGEREYLLEQVEYMYEDAYSRKMNRLYKDRWNDDNYYDKQQRLAKQMKDRGLDNRYSHDSLKARRSTFVDEPIEHSDTYSHFGYYKNKKNNSRIINKENYDSFVANRKKLQQTNDKLANKAPGNVLGKQYIKKQTNTNESTFDYLLESINDLYYDEY